jgi:hypothetical protein
MIVDWDIVRAEVGVNQTRVDRQPHVRRVCHGPGVCPEEMVSNGVQHENPQE